MKTDSIKRKMINTGVKIIVNILPAMIRGQIIFIHQPQE